MKKTRTKRAVSLLTASACMLSMLTTLPMQAMTASAAVQVANPFIYSDVPDDDIIRVGDTYYMVSTTMFFNPGAPIMKSKDLFSWEICNYVYDIYADGDVQNLRGGKHDYSHGQWATSLRYHDGMFYIFFGSYGSGKSYIYKTEDIENGPWTRSELNGMYHDASMLFDDDGRNYLVYGGGGEIKIKEFNAEMTDFKWGGVDKTLFKTNLTGLAGEGSHIQKIGDYYYVFVIAWPNGKPRIELCYRSKDLTGNYEGKEILNSGVGTYSAGVAQGGIVDTPDGKWYGLMFQDHGAIGRVPVLVPVTWQQDWPMLGENGKAPVTMAAPDGYKGTFLAKDDDFTYDSDKLMLEWQWNHNPDNKAWSVTEREGFLRLHNETIANNLLWARNTLTMRTEGPACSSVIKLDSTGMKPGDYAGLSAFQLNYGNVGVYVTDSGERRVYMAKNGGDDIGNSSNRIIEEAKMNGEEIYLKVEFNFATVDGNFNVSNNIDRANFFYSYDGSNWTKIGETLGMTYDLKLFTGYRSAIYSYPTKTTGGYADIDFFDYERSDFNVPVVIELDPDGYWFHYTFEKNTDGMSGRGSATVATSGEEKFAGEKSLLCSNRDASWNGASHSLSSAMFEPGKSYAFSVNVLYTDGEPEDKFHFTMQYTDSTGEAAYKKIATEVVKKGEWTQLYNPSFTIPEDASGINIYVETDESEISFYLDEMIGAPDGTAIGDGTPKEQPKEDVKLKRGDLNNDGIINAVDLTIVKQALLTDQITDAQKKAADVNWDNRVDIADLVWYQKYLTAQLTDFESAVVLD